MRPRSRRVSRPPRIRSNPVMTSRDERELLEGLATAFGACHFSISRAHRALYPKRHPAWIPFDRTRFLWHPTRRPGEPDRAEIGQGDPGATPPATSPGRANSRTAVSPGRSALAPLTVSVKRRSQPAPPRASRCRSRFWSSVETRA